MATLVAQHWGCGAGGVQLFHTNRLDVTVGIPTNNVGEVQFTTLVFSGDTASVRNRLTSAWEALQSYRTLRGFGETAFTASSDIPRGRRLPAA